MINHSVYIDNYCLSQKGYTSSYNVRNLCLSKHVFLLCGFSNWSELAHGKRSLPCEETQAPFFTSHFSLLLETVNLWPQFRYQPPISCVFFPEWGDLPLCQPEGLRWGPRLLWWLCHGGYQWGYCVTRQTVFHGWCGMDHYDWNDMKVFAWWRSRDWNVWILNSSKLTQKVTLTNNCKLPIEYSHYFHREGKENGD